MTAIGNSIKKSEVRDSPKPPGLTPVEVRNFMGVRDGGICIPLYFGNNVLFY